VKLLSRWTVLVLTLGIVAGCGERARQAVEAGHYVIVTRSPAGEAGLHPEPSQRLVSGSQLAALDLDAASEPRELSQGLNAAGSPSITIDGRQIIFIAREKESDPFSLFSSALDGSNRQRLVGEPYNCGGGAELPDGRIVFSATVEDAVPPSHFTSAWGLFVLSPESGEIQRITFSGHTEIDPQVLSDGRVLYSQWLPGGDGRSDTGSFALFTVHPDGTGAAPIHGQHGGPEWKLRPRQADSGDLFFVAAQSAGLSAISGTLWAAPDQNGFSLALPPALPLTVEPATGDRFLVATLPASQDEGGLLVVDREGRVLDRVQSGDPTWAIIDAVEVRSRRRPQGQLSMIDPAGDRGLLLAIDARPAGPLGRRAATARLRLASSAARRPRILGDLPLAADGSFFATVPANEPLLLDILDAEGNVLVETVSPIWVRPKEVRNCIGCHEDPETAPPNRRPLAVLEAPVDLVAEES